MSKKLTTPKFLEYVLVLAIFTLFDLLCNWVGYGVGLLEAFPGMLILLAISLFGIVLSHLISLKIPAIIYISIIGILFACPLSPVALQVIEYVGKINLLALATCLLGYFGVSMAKDWVEFRKIGLKGVIVVMFVMIGTYLGSALIAQLILSLQGII